MDFDEITSHTAAICIDIIFLDLHKSEFWLAIRQYPILILLTVQGKFKPFGPISLFLASLQDNIVFYAFFHLKSSNLKTHSSLCNKKGTHSNIKMQSILPRSLKYFLSSILHGFFISLFLVKAKSHTFHMVSKKFNLIYVVGPHSLSIVMERVCATLFLN